MVVARAFKSKFMIDSGACANVITLKDWRRLRRLKDASIIAFQWGNCRSLKAINKTEVKVLGKFSAHFEVADAQRPTTLAEFLIIDNAIDNIISHDTARKLMILKVGLGDTETINIVKEAPKTFPSIPGLKYRLSINESVPPVRNTSYFVPLAYEEDLDEQMWEWEETNIIERAQVDSPWCHRLDSAAKPGAKPGDKRRPIIDMRPANKAIYRDVFPMPSVETIAPKLAGARIFTKLDLKSAFHHIELHEESRFITTFMTKRGMMQFTRLPFGINVAPEVFQRVLQEILSGCEGCVNYIDDILIFAKNEEELESRTSAVIERLKANNLTLNTEKCEYRKAEVTFLGCKVNKHGMHPTLERMEAISKFRAPKTIGELRSFIGTANFIADSVKNFSSLTEPLRHLLHADQKWLWTTREQNAFEDMKKAIATDATPKAFYRSGCKTLLYTDASPWAIGAILAQEQWDEDLKTTKKVMIACASKSLTPTERRYYQTHRELLAVVWAVEKFTYFLIGIDFVIMTDHDPLQKTLVTTKASNKRMITRFEGWAMRLAPYSFTVERVPTKNNIADALSRLYEGKDKDFEVDAENELLAALGGLQIINENVERISYQNIRDASANCSTIAKIRESLLSGAWPKELRRFELVEQELELEGDVATRNGRFIPPDSMKIQILEIAHSSHASASSMKRLVRDRFWWPQMDVDINNLYENCEVCQQISAPAKPYPLQATRQPDRPWEFIALDHFSALYDKVTILVIQDYFSRFTITRFVETIDVKATINLLNEVFTIYGIPKRMRTDQGSTWKAEEFIEYVNRLNIKTEMSAPYAQWQNGLVERAMRTVKRAAISAIVIRDKERAEGKTATDMAIKTSIRNKVKRAIYVYNRTPHSTTGHSPIEILWGRKSTDIFPISDKCQAEESARNGWNEFREHDMQERNKSIEKANEKRKAPHECIEQGDIVLIKNTALGKLLPTFGLRRFEVIAVRGTNLVLTDNTGRRFDRHMQHVKKVGHKNTSESAQRNRKEFALALHHSLPFFNFVIEETEEPRNDTAVNPETSPEEKPPAAKRARTVTTNVATRQSKRDRAPSKRYPSDQYAQQLID